MTHMKQKTALDILKTGRNVFLTGAAGTGKTYLLRQYIKWLRENNIPLAITASTGIAATHLGGQTIHSWSGIGIKDYLSEWDLDAMSQKQALVKRVNSPKVLIIDEISMLKAGTLDMINELLKFLRQNDEPFGGMQVIVSGDFFQLPPVLRSTELEGMDTESIFAFSSSAWQEAGFKTLYLKEQYRQQDELIDILNAIRERELDGDLFKKLQARVGARPTGAPPVRLHTHNANVDLANESELQKIPGEIFESPMILKGNKARAENMARNVLAPEQLRLKVGARVMFVKNDPAQKYVNGSLGDVIDFSFGAPVVRLDSGEIIETEKSEWSIENESGKVLASVEQYPLRLAWAITVHKSQGMSMDAASMDLSKSFVPGQGYVALSRVRKLSGLFIEGLNDTATQVSDLVFEQDQSFQAESEQIEKIFENYSENKKREMQDKFIKENAAKNERKEKLASHLESLQLLNSLNSLQEIAKKRDLKATTIIGHFEKAQDEGLNFDISELKEIKKIKINKIFDSFERLGFEKLSPVYEDLKSTVNYDDLRLARILYKFGKEN